MTILKRGMNGEWFASYFRLNARLLKQQILNIHIRIGKAVEKHCMSYHISKESLMRLGGIPWDGWEGGQAEF